MKVQINQTPENSTPVLFETIHDQLVLQLANGKFVILESELEHEIRTIVEIDPDDLVKFFGSITISND